MQLDFIFSIIILIFSVVIHEVSHGYVAYSMGDNTAKYAGRLTLNPLKHLEWFGSFLMPLMSYFLGGFIIGWAKPVPFNPYNLSNQRWGEALVAFAGPAANILITLVLGFFIRFGIFTELQNAFATIVFINLILATLNLVPIPPLDGSKILFSVLPNSLMEVRGFLEKNSLFVLIFFIFFLWQFILPLVSLEFSLITGI
ncbi:MAG: site-2 protease family protein [Candidatus Zambryskibacteria bacterium]|nr:site-2 protease family protein [Candidatus Zambryskibacteria bacterium]